MVITKGPLTGTIASSNSGGFFGAELKFAGYDMVNLKVNLISQFTFPYMMKRFNLGWNTVVGKDVFETTDTLANEFGDGKARVSCIGPAGETWLNLRVL